MFLQKNFPASEPHFICDICSEAVTNPLCPFCLATEVEAWLTLYPNLHKELRPKIKNYLDDLEDSIFEEATNCVKCNRGVASICPYCFTMFILDELRKVHTNKIMNIWNESLKFYIPFKKPWYMTVVYDNEPIL